MLDDRLERLLALKAAAAEIADPTASLGKEARKTLLESSSLSGEGVEYALGHCLEHSVPRSTLSGMVGQTKMAARSHVLLSGNVFVAAFRAIALGLIQSPRTQVRSSRRAPAFARLLYEGSNHAFDLLEELTPRAGDHFWAYASDDTIAKLRATLPAQVHFHAHGSGMGAAVIREIPGVRSLDLTEAANALAMDTVAFDQRGCLSPRVVIVEGSREFAENFCNHLVSALARLEESIPRGPLSDEEKADALRHEATMTFVGSSVPAGMGLVFLDPEDGRVLIPPIGRYLHVTRTTDALPILKTMAPTLTTVSFFNGEHLPGLLFEAIGPRRYVDLGKMQTPAFDGPVDLRKGWTADVI